ncbi:MAG TPA: hypothetical protein VMU86_08700 [Steroidobacteraceae bacterium]|nr:hypothetical protein [Steroidobacteraceae bacterium]
MSLKASLRLTPIRRLTIHCPVSADTWRALLAGESAQLERAPELAHAHPWELPVIELAAAEILLPAPQAPSTG